MLHNQQHTYPACFGQGSGDLAILATAANQLFDATRDMSTDAVVSLLSALSEVSAKSLPAAASVATPRLAALSRMADTLLCNLHRIHELWGIFLAHVLEVMRSSNVQARTCVLL